MTFCDIWMTFETQAVLVFEYLESFSKIVNNGRCSDTKQITLSDFQWPRTLLLEKVS